MSPTRSSIPAWVKPQLDLRKWMAGWVDELRVRHEGRPWRGLHDEGIFTRTLPAFYLTSGHTPALEFASELADQFLDCPEAEACTCFLTAEDAAAYGGRSFVEKFHGYQADQSCLVHGPENYCWFLAHVAQAGGDRRYADALVDCAEHIGNFSAGVPDWYDWRGHRFRSALLGTRRVRDYAPYDYETLTHVRVMALATNAYALTGDRRYVELAVDWLDKWADVVLGSDAEFPCVLYPCAPERVPEIYGERIKAGTTPIHYELAHMFLDMCRIEPRERYVEAVRKMIGSSIGRGEWAMGNLLSKYRLTAADTSFDEEAVAIADRAMGFDDTVPGLIVLIDRDRRTPFEEVDYVRVAADGSVGSDDRSAGILACAYQITGDERYAEVSLRLAWMRFWAGWYLWDGRELGCRGSWSGRNGVAMHNVIPAYNTLCSGGFGMLEGELPFFPVYYRRADGSPGLPEDVAALCTPKPDAVRIEFANTGSEACSFFARAGHSCIRPPEPGEQWQLVELPARSAADAVLR